MKYIQTFSQINADDVSRVGGKNVNLGIMFRALQRKNIRVPDGFAVTVDAYRDHLAHNNLEALVSDTIKKVAHANDAERAVLAQALREKIAAAPLPDAVMQEVVKAYGELSKKYGVAACDVAVRSSATAEDLPGASFAGQQETYLNIRGVEDLCQAITRAFASLFTDRAMVYRIEKGFADAAIALSVGVQKMVRSDLGVSGVMFTLDTESGFKDAIIINAAYGLGETIVQGTVTPDEYVVSTALLHTKHDPIVRMVCGSKQIRRVYSNDAENPTRDEQVPENEQCHFALTHEQIIALAHMGSTIADYFTKERGAWTPMDIEWALDGEDHELYIVQARQETVHADTVHEIVEYQFVSKPSAETVITQGTSVGSSIAHGAARLLTSAADAAQFKDGDVLVATMTDPDWVPIIKRASAIVTDRGGRTCHAAIVSREFGIPAIVGTGNATTVIKQGEQITIDCATSRTGMVYRGIHEVTKRTYDATQYHADDAPVPIMVTIADPDRAFAAAQLPVSGVGLLRTEFLVNTVIGVHPMAIMEPEKVSEEVRAEIARRAVAYANPREWFVQTLARGIGMIAAAFYPRTVIVRLSDFKTNEYRELLGGDAFEIQEENPMLGFRGAARYADSRYAPAFTLECEALSYVRHTMGLENVAIMVPFVRTLGEAERVVKILEQHGHVRGKKGLKLIMMVEIPSNVLLITEFARYFDGFSIGSNDLTQLTLGLDRDAGNLAGEGDERDPAVMKMLELAILGAQSVKKPISICGQAPSDFPELAEQLIAWGITSLSLTPDAVLPFFLKNSGK